MNDTKNPFNSNPSYQETQQYFLRNESGSNQFRLSNTLGAVTARQSYYPNNLDTGSSSFTNNRNRPADHIPHSRQQQHNTSAGALPNINSLQVTHASFNFDAKPIPNFPIQQMFQNTATQNMTPFKQ
jgi:hypothetical protein